MRTKRVLWLLFIIPLVFAIWQPKASATENYTERVFISGYGQVIAVDPSKPEVIAGIKVNGPVRDMSFTADGKKGLILANGRTSLYVIDTVNNKVIDEINLQGRTDKGLLDRRVWGSAISPDGKKAYAFVTQGEKRKNIFKVHPSKIIEIDLETKEETRSVEGPYGTHVLQFKKGDSNTIFVWGYELYELDVKNMKIKMKQGLKTPKNEKDGSINFLMLFPRGENGTNSIPIVKTYPDGHVKEGFMWQNLETGKLKMLEYDREPIGMFSAVVDEDERYAYTTLNKWYKIDIQSKKIIKEGEPPVGSMYGVTLSVDGEKLYYSGAGNEFIVANKDLKVEKIITLPTDTLDLKVVKIQK
ncbi:DNA-binding beta-propeller fold protein YncE [Oikeobacillus pervagus]|uniref:DNA-binding beta-propeller fold protein YncE n=1 Tax=Oikeobacillus pervagus TaxID=1325931 RepID=A0AAJ1T329_9BACI|nr:hypothetical protein [Oikeobacillus pervagus]MDQ0215887.1 DNA-binding beta-propeller fold protein YncE [Oikeobacillus pervagus]